MESGAFYTLVPIRPRSRGERRSLRTLGWGAGRRATRGATRARVETGGSEEERRRRAFVGPDCLSRKHPREFARRRSRFFALGLFRGGLIALLATTHHDGVRLRWCVLGEPLR
eukprot:30753-Pelagococcus_subviridis.AAC.5